MTGRRHILPARALALIVALLPLWAAGQRRLFASEGDMPQRSWIIAGFNDSTARAAIGESPAGAAEGIWQATADGARVALVAGDAPGLWRCDIADAPYSGVRRLLMVILDSPRPGIRSGTVMGWASPSATPGKWEAQIFTRTDGRELDTPRKFTLTLADASHISFAPASSGLRVRLWKLIPYFFRSALTETPPQEGHEGLLRLWPPPADAPPLNPVYL